MRARVIVTVCAMMAIHAATVVGLVRLPRLLSSGMVLQRETNVRIWGWGAPGERVTIRFIWEKYTAVTGPDSAWEVMLPPMKAGGPFSMEIDGYNHIVLDDIMIGDVWVCSGQSNMQLPMARVEWKYPDVIAKSANPHIRQLLVPNEYNFGSPAGDIGWTTWESANPSTVLRFTAAGYFFAKTLYDRYHVPIGLIDASVGGTPIEAWMSRDALAKFPAILAAGEKFSSKEYRDSIMAHDDSSSASWQERVWSGDRGLNGDTAWYVPGYDDSGWRTITLPGYWADGELGKVNGVVWFRKDFNVPARLAGKPARLIMGRIVDADYQYVNGVFVGSVAYQYPPRRYDIAPGILKSGRNTIAVRVINSNGLGGFVKDKEYALLIGKDLIDMTGQWRYKLGVAAKPMAPGTTIIYQPIGCFNAMIAPLLKCTIRGVVWYQGESNASRPEGYGQKFSSMIADWRAKWGIGDFPFIYVQLPNYGESVDHPVESRTAELREAQSSALRLPMTGMAVTIDIGEWNDIHPLNKKDVGARLALAAMKVAYGNDRIVFSGPVCDSVTIEGSSMVASFSNIGSGLVARGGNLKCFEIAGKDGRYFIADAKIVRNNVVIWSRNVPEPVSVRYAWSDNPAGANLYNNEGLPASPFRAGR